MINIDVLYTLVSLSRAVTKSGTGTWGLGRGTRVWDVGRVGWDVGTWGRGDVGTGTWGCANEEIYNIM